MSDKLSDGFYWVRLAHYAKWTIAEKIGRNWIACGFGETLSKKSFAEIGSPIASAADEGEVASLKAAVEALQRALHDAGIESPIEVY